MGFQYDCKLPIVHPNQELRRRQGEVSKVKNAEPTTVFMMLNEHDHLCVFDTYDVPSVGDVLTIGDVRSGHEGYVVRYIKRSYIKSCGGNMEIRAMVMLSRPPSDGKALVYDNDKASTMTRKVQRKK
jgi:hypothetical protein